MGISSDLAGAEIITFFAPAAKCFWAPSRVRKAPVHSKTVFTFEKSYSGIITLIKIQEDILRNARLTLKYIKVNDSYCKIKILEGSFPNLLSTLGKFIKK